MKKLLYLLFVSLLAAAVVSCSKDSDNTPDIPANAIAVSFNTGSLYKDLGILESMADVISPAGSYIIIDSVLVYNQNGGLVTKSGVESNSFDNTALVLNDIPKGIYTLVLWQTTYRTTDGVRAWKVADEESLSTVNVSSDGGSFNYFWALGIASATVELSGNGIKVDLTPKTVGCIVDATIDNYPEDMGYDSVYIMGGKHSTGVYLDPARKNDPWIPSKFTGGLFRVMPGTNGKGMGFSLLHGEAIDLWIRGDKGDDNYDELGYISPKKLAAGEKYTLYFDNARANWQPAFFGSAEDFASWKADRDAGLLVLNPCLEWGIDLPQVEEYVHQKNWWDEVFDYLYPYSDGWSKAYWVAEKLQEAYNFETEDGKNLRLVFCFCDDTSLSVDVAYDMLIKQGFTQVGEIQFPEDPHTYLYFVNADKTSQAVINDYMFTNWAVAYEPYCEEDQQYLLP